MVNESGGVATEEAGIEEGDAENVCINIKPMAEWLEEPEKEGDCKPCRLAVVVGDYQKTLEDAGHKQIAAEIGQAMGDKDDPILKVAQVMDKAKEAVDEDTRTQLLALDCLAQRGDIDTDVGE